MTEFLENQQNLERSTRFAQFSNVRLKQRRFERFLTFLTLKQRKMSSELVFFHQMVQNDDRGFQKRFVWISSLEPYEKPVTIMEKQLTFGTKLDPERDFSILSRIPDLKLTPKSLAKKFELALNQWFQTSPDILSTFGKIPTLPTLITADKFEDLPWIQYEYDVGFIEFLAWSYTVTGPQFSIKRFTMDEILLGDPRQLMDLMTCDYRKIVSHNFETVCILRRIENDENLTEIQNSIESLNSQQLKLAHEKVQFKVKTEPQSPVQVDENLSVEFEDQQKKIRPEINPEIDKIKDENAKLKQIMEMMNADILFKNAAITKLSEELQTAQTSRDTFQTLSSNLTVDYLSIKRQLEKKEKTLKKIQKLSK